MEHILREEGLIQSSKVQLQNTSNGIHVMVILVSCQWILTLMRTSRKHGETPENDFQVLPPGSKHLTSLKGILDVIDLHLRARHSEDTFMLQTYKRTQNELVKPVVSMFAKPLWLRPDDKQPIVTEEQLLLNNRITAEPDSPWRLMKRIQLSTIRGMASAES